MYANNIIQFPIENRNRDLPQGAVKVSDDLMRAVDYAYRKLREFYRSSRGKLIRYERILMGIEVLDSGDLSKGTIEDRLELFNGELHPKVNGNEWYRGFAIKTNKGLVLIYVPWLFEGKSSPEAYLLGEVSYETLHRLITVYANRILQEINKLRGHKIR